jgi:hypothetical protein
MDGMDYGGTMCENPIIVSEPFCVASSVSGTCGELPMSSSISYSSVNNGQLKLSQQGIEQSVVDVPQKFFSNTSIELDWNNTTFVQGVSRIFGHIYGYDGAKASDAARFSADANAGKWSVLLDEKSIMCNATYNAVLCATSSTNQAPYPLTPMSKLCGVSPAQNLALSEPFKLECVQRIPPVIPVPAASMPPTGETNVRPGPDSSSQYFLTQQEEVHEL